MDQVYTFHETVRGHLHVMNEFPCEDSSASFSADKGRYHIAIVSDGHGSKSCFRSDYGSKVATEVTLECLQQFAESMLASEELEERFYKDIFSNPRYRHMTVRRLTDTILAEWHDRVLEDYNKNPPTLEEMGESAVEYQNGKNIEHIYGATLIAALKTTQCLILIQQGDGRCDVFYEDGSVDQPIPWDSRCEDTATTSLCDLDAAESFRSCVVNLSEKPIIACYIGCDVIEDAYRDTYEGLGGSHTLMGGVHTFYRYLTCQINDKSKSEFENWLPEFLTNFSANGIFSRSGSGDDVSVSGIVDLSKIDLFTKEYTYKIKLYSLEEDLFWREDELRGKMRKHGILKKRYDNAKLDLENAVAENKSLIEMLERLQEKRVEFVREIDEMKQELEEYRQDAESAKGQFEGRYTTRFASAMQRFIDEISFGYSQKEASYSKMLEHLMELDEEIKLRENEIDASEKKLNELSLKRDEAQSLFEEYDSKYQAINTEHKNIINQIADLKERMQIE